MILEQIKTVNPSVAPALFRLIMRSDDTAYLREDDSIIGFEISHDSPPISGFALIGMRKRTILSYRSEDATPRLVIFPSMDKLFDHSFELLTLHAKKMRFRSDKFKGELIEEGVIADLVRDLTPPEKNVELPDSLTEQMIRVMISQHSDQEVEDVESGYAQIERFKPIGEQVVEQPKPKPKVSNDPIPIGSNPFTQPEITVDDLPPMAPDEDVRSRKFTSENDVMGYVIKTYGVDDKLLSKLLVALLPKMQGQPTAARTTQYQQLVAKLLKEKPEVIADDKKPR